VTIWRFRVYPYILFANYARCILQHCSSTVTHKFTEQVRTPPYCSTSYKKNHTKIFVPVFTTDLLPHTISGPYINGLGTIFLKPCVRHVAVPKILRNKRLEWAVIDITFILKLIKIGHLVQTLEGR
jgi:hypothetical protein